MSIIRNFIKRIVVALVILITAVMVFSYASPAVLSTNDTLSSFSPAAQGNITFTTGWSGTLIDNFNPFNYLSQLWDWMESYVYLPLVSYDTANRTVMPALASSWSLNYTNHTAIFHLNPNAVWSDGVPVTAQDVVYTYQEAAQPWSSVAEYVSAINNVTAINNSTVMIHFAGTLYLYFAATIYIVPYHIWKNVNASTYFGVSNGTAPYFVGDGPFLITKYVINQYAEISRNPKFFIPSETPKIDNVIFDEFSSPTAAISALEDGEIQGLSGILPANVATFSNSSSYKVSDSPGERYIYIGINLDKNGTGNKALLNLTVRKAMAHAINLTYLNEVVNHGYGTPLSTVLTPSNLYYDQNLKPYAYNVTLANDMLNAAGYKIGPNGYRVSPNGTPLKFSMIVDSGDTISVDYAQLIAQNLTAIGIDVTVNAETTGTMAATIWQSNGTLGQDMDLWDWFDTPYTPYLLNAFRSNQIADGVSDSGFNNSTYDNLYNEMLNTTSPSQAKNYAYEMQTILYDQLPYIVLDSPATINVWSSAWTDINASSFGGPFGGEDWQTFLTATPVSSTHQTPTSNLLVYEILIIVVVLIVIAIAAVLLVVRNRKKLQESPEKKS